MASHGLAGNGAQVEFMCCRAASVEALDMSMPLSSETLPDDDREARAAQSQQEQGQVSFLTTAACLGWPCLFGSCVAVLVFWFVIFFLFLRHDDSKAKADKSSRDMFLSH